MTKFEFARGFQSAVYVGGSMFALAKDIGEAAVTYARGLVLT